MWSRFALLLALVVGLGWWLPAQTEAHQTRRIRHLTSTTHFAVYLEPGALTRDEALRFVERLEPTLAQVERRFGTAFQAKERVELHPPQRGDCAVRGLTYSGRRLIQLFYGPGSDIDRMQSLMAHELVHQLQRERFGDRVHQRSDIILLEGWATVASDDFARTPDGSEPRWRARLREVVARGELLPLTTDLDRDCRTTTRNSIYDQWASFVDFLQQQYGQDALAAVYAKGKGRKAGTADYKAVYGKTFAELEAAWREWVVTQSAKQTAAASLISWLQRVDLAVVGRPGGGTSTYSLK